MNDILHKKHTKVSNQLIAYNLERLVTEHVEIWIRTPLIPNVNDKPEEMQAIIDFVSSLKTINKHEFLPYHRYRRDD